MYYKIVICEKDDPAAKWGIRLDHRHLAHVMNPETHIAELHPFGTTVILTTLASVPEPVGDLLKQMDRSV